MSVRVGWNSLRAHLQEEMRQSKFVVAREFSFQTDYILWHMALQYLTYNKGFQNAGELICILEDSKLIVDTEDELYELICSISEKDASTAAEDQRCPPINELDVEKSMRKKTTDLDRKSPSASDNMYVEKLREETMKLWIKRSCRKCYQNNFDYMILDCCCLGLCEPCSKICRMCPICKRPIRQLIQVFM